MLPLFFKLIILALMNNNPQLAELFKHNQVLQQHPFLRFKQPVYTSFYHHGPKAYFYEEQIFFELQRTAIVEDYLSGMREDYKDVEIQSDKSRIKVYQTYQELSSNQKTHQSFNNLNLLDSQSSGRQLPSRNSSVSSFTSESQNSLSQSLHLKKKGHVLQSQQNKSQLKIKIQIQTAKKSSKRGRQVGSDTEKRQKLNKINKIQQLGCNCKKSKCLKMYCECFNLQILCGQNCNCIGCGNMTQNQTHQKAVLEALTRNPKAFAEDLPVVDSIFQLGVQLSQVRKGCKCRKTQCKKKYCQCFYSGMSCGIFCQCQQCENKMQAK